MARDDDEPIFIQIDDPSDVADGEFDEPERRGLDRRWIGAGIALIAVAALVIVNRPDHSGDGQAAPPAITAGSSALTTPPLATRSPATTPPPATTGSGAPQSAAADITGFVDEGVTGTAQPDPNPSGPNLTGQQDACGHQVDLVDLTGLREDGRTGLSVITADGSRVDLDTGLVTTPLIGLADNEVVEQTLRQGEDTYLLISTCTYESANARVLRILPDGRTNDVRVALGRNEEILGLQSDGATVQVQVFDRVTASVAGLQPIEGGPLTPLPKGFQQIRLYPGSVLGIEPSATDTGVGQLEILSPESDLPQILGLVNLIGPSYLVAHNDSQLIWYGKDRQGARNAVHTYDLDSGKQTTLGWEPPEGFRATLLSPDGKYLLGAVDNPFPDTDDDTLPFGLVMPVDYQVLNVADGGVTSVPQLVRMDLLSTALRMDFAPDGHQLVLAADTTTGTRYLTWTPGTDSALHQILEVPGISPGNNGFLTILPGTG